MMLQSYPTKGTPSPSRPSPSRSEGATSGKGDRSGHQQPSKDSTGTSSLLAGTRDGLQSLYGSAQLLYGPAQWVKPSLAASLLGCITR
eukprot:47819-Pelagomonas_calceolata.AAC.4